MQPKMPKLRLLFDHSFFVFTSFPAAARGDFEVESGCDAVGVLTRPTAA
jgi:hypothetical protein